MDNPLCKAVAIGVLLATAALAACGPHKSYAPYGNVPTLADEQYNVSTLPPYTLQVGDQLALDFPRNPELNQEVVVRPDGKISLPFVGEIRCAGLTPDDLDQEIQRRFEGELAVPDVVVLIIGLGGNRVFIDGEVFKPGMLELSAGMTLQSAIASAGGFTPKSIPAQVILVRRDASGKPVGHSVDLSDVVTGKNAKDDVLLQPFDIVYVPRSKIANAGLWVEQYIRNMLPIHPRLAIPIGAFL